MATRAKKIVEEPEESSITVKAFAETTTDKNGASTTRVTADLLLGPNRQCQINLEDGRAFAAGLTGPSGEIACTLPAFTGAFTITRSAKDDDTIYAEGVA